MKILFVCVDRYPYDGACTSLLKKLFFNGGGLIEKGNEIHIATYRQQFDDKDDEIVDEVRIHRLLSPRFLSISELLRHKREMGLFIKGIFVKIKKRAEQKLKNGYENLDKAQIAEFKKYLRALVEKETLEIVVSVAGCYEMAIAAQIVSEEKRIPYILYQVDPFTDNIMFSSRSAEKRIEIEKRLYRCSRKVFTTEIILSKMRERMRKEELSNTEVMEFPGVSVDFSKGDKRQTCDGIDCVFAGRIYRGVRNPTYTIKMFQELPQNIRLKLYGVTAKELRDDFSIETLPNNVICYGLVSVEEAENAMKNADVLVNIGNIMLNQVPSKLFSYISTGKPLLNICANHECSSKPYLEKYPYALSIDEAQSCDDVTVKEVMSFLTENAGKTCDLHEIEVLYEKCTPVYAASQMQAAFIQAYEER